jgi:uncharacterized SAM-binding protein YcdF (DUF218 family)
MDTLAQLIKDYLIPGSTSFFLLGCACGLAMLFFRRTRTLGRNWLVLLVSLYYVSSTPVGAQGLEALLAAKHEPIRQVAEAGDAEAVVVLGGGGATYRTHGSEFNALSEASILRLLEGVRLYQLLEPDWLILSGGTNLRAGVLTAESLAMKNTAVQMGVPQERILVEKESDSTYQQALNLRSLLDDHGVHQFVLVTSPTHMPRALATFRTQGMSPIPSPSQQHSAGYFQRGCWALPDDSMLRASSQAYRELLALAQYTLLGRMARP